MELLGPRSPLTSLSHSSLGGCSSGDMIPPTLFRTPWPVFVMRVACSSARWSIHITTFWCLSPAGIGCQPNTNEGILHQEMYTETANHFSIIQFEHQVPTRQLRGYGSGSDSEHWPATDEGVLPSEINKGSYYFRPKHVFRDFKIQTKLHYSTLLWPKHFTKQYKHVCFCLCFMVDRNNSFTILSDGYRLEALVQHH